MSILVISHLHATLNLLFFWYLHPAFKCFFHSFSQFGHSRSHTLLHPVFCPQPSFSSLSTHSAFSPSIFYPEWFWTCTWCIKDRRKFQDNHEKPAQGQANGPILKNHQPDHREQNQDPRTKAGEGGRKWMHPTYWQVRRARGAFQCETTEQVLLSVSAFQKVPKRIYLQRKQAGGCRIRPHGLTGGCRDLCMTWVASCTQMFS